VKRMKRRQRQQLALLTLVVLIASVVAILLLTPGFNIKKIEVRGNMVLKEEEIIRASGLVTGENIFGVNLGAASEGIESLGYIESVKVKRDLPSTIVITVVEEIGVAYLVSEEGYVVITADGRCVEVTDGVTSSDEGKKVSAAPSLPKIVGMKGVKYKEGNIIASKEERQLEALLTCLHEFTKYEYIFDMVEIDVTEVSDIKFYYKSKNLCVSLGNYNKEKIGYRMECFGPIFNYAAENTKEGAMPSGYVNLERLTYRKNQPATADNDKNAGKTQ